MLKEKMTIEEFKKHSMESIEKHWNNLEEKLKKHRELIWNYFKKTN